MQQKVRINDLARELEVKSKVILDLLLKVGVTEKKTHSSSIEVDEAERVRKYYAEHGEGGGAPAKGIHPAREEFKPKIDLSHISKPGDVLKAITQKAAQPATPSRLVAPQGPPRTSVTPAAAVPSRPPSVAPKPPAVTANAAPAAPVEPPKPAPRLITPQTIARPAATVVIPPKPPVTPPPPVAEAPTSPAIVAESIETVETTPPAPVESQPAEAQAEVAVAPTAPVEPEAEKPASEAPAAQTLAAPAKPVTVLHKPAAPPPRRLIVPQTGPRPVYSAPVRP